ncbi:hypothetical protein [uncultured Hymenobacter sp.]|uniref:hypothetical protein n=1 Tax=uncultured Hymenobacter sp. TaxID=170016 RepID=UPI0035C9CD44
MATNIVIRSKDDIKSAAIQYAAIVTVASLVTAAFGHAIFSIIMFVLLALWLINKFMDSKRVYMIVLKEDDVEIYFQNLRRIKTEKFKTTDLSAVLNKEGGLRGKPYYVLEIRAANKNICSIETRDGFEESALRKIFALLSATQLSQLP